MIGVAKAQEALIKAVLAVLVAERSDDVLGHEAAAEGYAGEMLALVARDLVAAVDALPPAEQPVGWRPEVPSECCGGTGFADFAAVPCPNPACPVLAAQNGAAS